MPGARPCDNMNVAMTVRAGLLRLIEPFPKRASHANRREARRVQAAHAKQTAARAKQFPSRWEASDARKRERARLRTPRYCAGANQPAPENEFVSRGMALTTQIAEQLVATELESSPKEIRDLRGQ